MDGAILLTSVNIAPTTELHPHGCGLFCFQAKRGILERQARAKGRQIAAGGDRGNQYTGGKPVMETFPEAVKGTTRDKIGAALDMSGKIPTLQ